MTIDLDKAVSAVYTDLANRKVGSVRTAQRLVKLLRAAGRTKEAVSLVREFNRHAKHIPREDW